MRKKREINDLEAKAKEIEFPLANHRFDRFKAELREIIDENCGYSIAKTLEYDEYDQLFNVYVEVSNQMLPLSERDADDVADRACMSLTRGMTINPREPLGPQIEKVVELKEAMHRRHNMLCTMLSLFKEGYQMRK